MRTLPFPPHARQLAGDRRGATIVEFAIVAPVMGILLLGAFDVAHTLYAQAVLQGVVQKVARDSALEGNTGTDAQTALDTKVSDQVKQLNKNATVTFKRRFFRDYANIASNQPEAFTDTNSNGTCDPGSGGTPGEPYQDANNNGMWDRDGGNGGQGGAKDATLYTVTMSYERLFPFWRIVPSQSHTTTISASTVLRNQPYADQGSYGAAVARNCS